MQPASFGTFLKKHGLVSPSMMGKEYEEEEMMREDLENRKNHLDRAGLLDDPDDQTHFEISIVNKYNTALNLDACVIDGQLVFNKIKVVPEDGI